MKKGLEILVCYLGQIVGIFACLDIAHKLTTFPLFL